MGVKLNDLTISYNRHPAIHHISGEFPTGSLTAIAGPNGAGKSTLLKSLAGMIEKDSGTIDFGGIRKNEIAYLPQASEIARDFPINVMQLVVTGSWQKTGGFGNINRELRQKANEALEKVGITGFEKRPISTLSIGQFQRVLFARLLMQEAKLILLDEPFNAVDDETAQKLLQIILNWHRQGKTIISVLHDLNQIRSYFPECLLIARKCVAWCNSADALQPEKLRSARMFQEAWNESAEVCAV